MSLVSVLKASLMSYWVAYRDLSILPAIVICSIQSNPQLILVLIFRFHMPKQMGVTCRLSYHKTIFGGYAFVPTIMIVKIDPPLIYIFYYLHFHFT